jgi:signal transduction histidine kinase
MRSFTDAAPDGRTSGKARAAALPAGGGAGAAVAPIKPSILIVDDKPRNLFALAQMLEGLDGNVVQATSGAEALRYLLRENVAIILVDIQMPDMDGYELAALIRRRERSRDTPVIFITAFNKEDRDISRGYALGAVDYVFKPIDPVILRAKVSVFVDLFKKTEVVRQQAEIERRLLSENLRVRTEKIEAERALRQIEERQALIIRSLPIALYTAEVGGSFSGPRFLSESIAGAVGFAANAFIEDADLWTARIHPADRPRVLSQVGSIVETGRFSIEYRWRCADGSERTFLDQAVLLRDEAGVAREIIGTCLDVTDRRRLERQLLQSQKMEALGQLTGGIAHDFNNMLSVIIWNLDTVTKSLKGGGKLYDRAQMALNGALNCAELIRQLLTFTRHQPRQARAIDLLELVPRMARMLAPVIGEQIELDTALPEGLWPIFADAAQVKSALLNLAINSRDAMPHGGRLTIEASNIHHSAVDPELAPRDYVMLSVKDTGVGMPSEVAERAFEPFFTTKPQGEGTGLGLSMVYGFVKQSQGHVRIESEVGAGTTIRLYLPRAEALPACAEDVDSERPAAAAETCRTILVVEDNADVRGVTVTRLEEIGHRVLAADCAAAALDILSGDAPVDLLFTDVVMPGGVSGLELARRARDLRPAIRVIFTSGYDPTLHPSSSVAGEFLQKPYRDEDLDRVVRQAFNDAAAPGKTVPIAEPDRAPLG